MKRFVTTSIVVVLICSLFSMCYALDTKHTGYDWSSPYFLLWLLLGVISAIVAYYKHRSVLGWFLVGSFFGPLGLLVCIFPKQVRIEQRLPPVESPEQDRKSARQVSGILLRISQFGNVTKILILIVILVVAYHAWDINTNSQANFAFYELRNVAQKLFFKSHKFTQGAWGKGSNCPIAYEYDSYSPSELERTIRFEVYMEKLSPCKDAIWQALIVRKIGDTYHVLINFKKGTDTDPEVVRSVKEIANQLSAYVFDSHPVDIHMCDSFFNTNRVVVSR